MIGGLAGSLLINRRLEDFLREFLGDKHYARLRWKDGYREAMKQFEERIKPGFTSRNQKEEVLTFPGAGLRNNSIIRLKRDSLPVPGYS